MYIIAGWWWLPFDVKAPNQENGKFTISSNETEHQIRAIKSSNDMDVMRHNGVPCKEMFSFWTINHP